MQTFYGSVNSSFVGWITSGLMNYKSYPAINPYKAGNVFNLKKIESS